VNFDDARGPAQRICTDLASRIDRLDRSTGGGERGRRTIPGSMRSCEAGVPE
jgi:hypothetical protein